MADHRRMSKKSSFFGRYIWAILIPLMIVVLLFRVSGNGNYGDDSAIAAYNYYLSSSLGGKSNVAPCNNDLLSDQKLALTKPADTIDCPSLLDKVRKGEQLDPNGGKMYARYTKVYPHFWVSLHNIEYDPVRFGTLEWGKYYEKHLSKAFTDVLDGDGDDNSLVIDVGGNIGWFTLLSASLGHNVHVFEPNLMNVIRMCESICMNGWEQCGGANPPGVAWRTQGQVHIRTVGLKDKQGEFWLRPNGLSPGAGKVVQDIETEPSDVREKSQRVQIKTLDQLADELGWYKLDNVKILKVDVEGVEFDVFQGGKKFLESKKVQNIFMEGNIESVESTQKFNKLVDQLLTVGYRVYKLGGSIGPARNDIPHAGKQREGILWACEGYGGKRKRRQCNIWWRLANLPNVTETAALH